MGPDADCVSSVPVAVITNGFRVAGTGIAAHKFGPEAAQGFFHEFSGWLVFVAAFALMIGLQQLIAATLARTSCRFRRHRRGRLRS